MKYLIGGYGGVLALAFMGAGAWLFDVSLLALAVPTTLVALFGWCLESQACGKRRRVTGYIYS